MRFPTCFRPAPTTNNLKKENSHILSLTFRRGGSPVLTAGYLVAGAEKTKSKHPELIINTTTIIKHEIEGRSCYKIKHFLAVQNVRLRLSAQNAKIL